MKNYTLYVALCTFLLVPGCASLPPQVAEASETLDEVCNLYQTHRPLIVEARAYFVAHWDELPPALKDSLRKIDQALPALDAGGVRVCDASQVTAALTGASLNRDEIGAAILRVVSMAVELKANGVF
jgi:hypothetical protein